MELRLSSMEYVVFDEADRLFEMGFSEQLHEIIRRLPESRYYIIITSGFRTLLLLCCEISAADKLCCSLPPCPSYWLNLQKLVGFLLVLKTQ